MAAHRHSTRRLITITVLGLTGVMLGGIPLTAVDLNVPVDVPDEVGLGERLALIAWLGEHKIAVADANDLPTLRLAYLTRAHPELVTPSAGATQDDRRRGELAAELYRKHGINPPAGADANAIAALIAHLDAESDAALARDQAKATADSTRPDTPRPVVTTTSPPPTARLPAPPVPVPAPGTPPQDPEQIAAGAVIGKPFPEFSGRTLAGSAFRLSDLRGKVVLIDFWATWCGPCRGEMPNVKAVYDTYHAKGFEVVGVSLDNDKQQLTEGVAALGIPWTQLFEGAGWDTALARKFAVRSIPATFLIGKDGVLLAHGVRGPALGAAVEQALGK